MTFDEWKQAGSPPPMSFEQWKASQGQTGTAPKPAGPDYAGDVETFRNRKLMDKPLQQQGAVGDFLSGLGHGAMAPVRGVRQAYNWATGDEKKLAELQRQEEEEYNKLGGWGKAGNVAGQVGTAFIPVAGQVGKLAQGTAAGAKALSATQKLGAGAKAAGVGAGVAALDPTMSKEGKAQDYATEKAKDIALGAGFGAAGQQVGRFFSGASDAVKQASKDLGGMATPGQLLAARQGTIGGPGWAEAERRIGMYLPGSGITSARDKAHDAAVNTMLAREAERAGVNVAGGQNFKDLYKSVQEGKSAAYQNVVPDLSLGKSLNRVHRETNVSFGRATQGLTQPVRDDVASALAQAGINPALKGKTHLGAYQGENVQNVLSTLNKEISSRFGQNATRQDNVAGEALIKIRDDMMKSLEKNTPKEAFEQYQKLGRLHQAVGPETQTKRGVFGRAGHYINAQERGTPTLREVGQAASAGRQTKAKNEMAEEAARLEQITGKHSTTGQGHLSKIIGYLGAPLHSAASLGATLAPNVLYNKMSIKMLNKLAQEGNPQAQRALLAMGKGAAATDTE